MMTMGAASATGTACAARTTRAIGTAAGAVGESGLEDALQFGGLIAGQLAAGDLALDQIVDLGFQVIGRGSRPDGLVAGAAGLDRGIDIGQRRRQRVLVGRA